MILSEWKKQDKVFPTYNDTVVYYSYFEMINDPLPYNFSNEYPTGCWNDTSNNTHYPCNHTYQSGTQLQSVCQWTPTKLNMFNPSVLQPNIGTGKSKGKKGNVNIPKFSSKNKYDAFNTLEQGNGTKFFNLCFDTPISNHLGGWGSVGKVAVVDGNTKME